MEKIIKVMDMEDHIEEQVREGNPVIQAILIGIAIIITASIAKFIVVWINFPGSITSIGEFFQALLDSFIFVLNFDFKVWWVFLLIIYLVARFYKKN